MISDLFKNRRVRWGIVLSIGFLLLFAHADRTGLKTDSYIYAAIARTMADSGDYGNLRVGEQPYYNKPPLLFWLSALAIRAMGPTPFAVTLFSRLFAIACIVLTGWMASRLLDSDSIGWLAAFVIATTHAFLHEGSQFKMDSGLTCGILVAVAGYLRGDQKWGPPVFYAGVILGVLAKGPPGALPLFLAPLHAALAGHLRPLWDRRTVRWLLWSPLLLLAFAWWAHLWMHQGSEPLTIYFDNLARTNYRSRMVQFWNRYVLDFALKTYWPWLPFAVVGVWISFRSALDVNRPRIERGAHGLLLAWIALVLVEAALPEAQYARYIIPALPALSTLVALATERILRERLLDRLVALMAVGAVAGAFAIACFPLPLRVGEQERSPAMAEILNHRLAPKRPVQVLTVKADDQGNARLSLRDESWCVFFLSRPGRPITPEGIQEAVSRGRLTLLVPIKLHPSKTSELGLYPLIIGSTYALVEAAPSAEPFP
jgi:4-amino-4-deoxy-L-arabinose transferase-like glycosyltransferase